MLLTAFYYLALPTPPNTHTHTHTHTHTTQHNTKKTKKGRKRGGGEKKKKTNSPQTEARKNSVMQQPKSAKGMCASQETKICQMQTRHSTDVNRALESDVRTPTNVV
jgi:hypothetical protein